VKIPPVLSQSMETLPVELVEFILWFTYPVISMRVCKLWKSLCRRIEYFDLADMAVIGNDVNTIQWIETQLRYPIHVVAQSAAKNGRLDILRSCNIECDDFLMNLAAEGGHIDEMVSFKWRTVFGYGIFQEVQT